MLPKKKSSKALMSKQTLHTEQSFTQNSSIRKLSACDKAPLAINRSINNSIEINKRNPILSNSTINKPVSAVTGSVTIKDLQAYEKKAIKLFYEKKYQQTFKAMTFCLEIVEKIDSLEHKIYINYLYTEFFYKLKQFENSMEHYQQTQSLYRSANHQQQKALISYIKNIQCLYLSILFETDQFEKILSQCNNIINIQEEGSPNWVQCKNTKLKCFYELKMHEQAIILGTDIIEYITKPSDKVKHCIKLTYSYQTLCRNQEAMEMLEHLLREVQSLVSSEQINSIYSRIAQMSVNLEDEIKTIYCLQKIKINSPNLEQLTEVCKMLCRLYHQMGDYEKSIQNADVFVNKTSEHQYLNIYADSQYRLGNAEQALNIYEKVLCQEKKLIDKYRVYHKMMGILEGPELEELEELFIQDTQKYRNSDSVIGITEYANYLRKIGEQSKAESFYKHAANQAFLSKLPQFLFAIYYNLGQLLEVDRRQESLMYYTKALKLNIEHELLCSIRDKIKALELQK